MAVEKGKRKNLREAPQKEHKDEQPELTRDSELMDEPGVRDTMSDLFTDIETNLDAHAQRSDNTLDNWDLYNCKLGTRQFYNGTNQIYVPIVRDALEARKTRFTNQLFPRSGRYADCISEDATRPSALMSLLDFYVRKCRLKTSVVPSLIKHGDLEGQYSIYISWVKNERHVCWKTSMDGVEPGTTVETIKEDVITHAYPHVEVLADQDLLILPTACDSIESALSQGGCVVVLRRWTKTKIKQQIADGEIEKEAGKQLLLELSQDSENPRTKDPVKTHLDIAGIKKDGRGRYALVYEIWTKLLIQDEKRLCRAYMAGKDRLLSAKRNPYWSDKIPVLSVPKDKVADAIKGRAPVDAVRDFQIAANDAVNMGMDSAAYALMPIIMTDPEKNPHIGSMILTMAAVWRTNPNDTQFAKFPPLWKDAFEIVQNARQQVFQTLGVNPANITQTQTVKKKLNQAEVALEQQVDILTTADAVSVVEEGILTPMLERFIELDHQFRDESITVPAFGEMGYEAKMERIEPIQFDRRYHFLWYGVEAARNAQQIQQQISGINVLRGIPPQLYEGYKLDLVPALTYFVENAFGPRLAPQIFVDLRRQLSVDPQEENKALEKGIEVHVHQMDDHAAHIQSHVEHMQHAGDMSGQFKVHIMRHKMAMTAAMMQQQGQGQPGTPGGGGQGMPGQPRQGGQSQPPRGGQQPPGAVHADQMNQQPGIMPRRAG